LIHYELDLSKESNQLTYTLDTKSEYAGGTRLLDDLRLAGIAPRDLHAIQNLLEEIFVDIAFRSS
jgi:hypothetical protein